MSLISALGLKKETHVMLPPSDIRDLFYSVEFGGAMLRQWYICEHYYRAHTPPRSVLDEESRRRLFFISTT